MQFMLAMSFPAINPVAIEIGPVVIKWYGLAYMAGLLLGWLYIRRLIETPRLWPGDVAPFSVTKADDLLLFMTAGVIIGGRLGSVLFYEPGYYLKNPIEIFQVWKGGMAFHGALVGTAVAIWLYARINKVSTLSTMDSCAAAVPLGLFFGRLANFINGELWGRPSDVPWAMVFPSAGPQARHPSQLYEALTEGLLLFIVLRIMTHSRLGLKSPRTGRRRFPGRLRTGSIDVRAVSRAGSAAQVHSGDSYAGHRLFDSDDRAGGMVHLAGKSRAAGGRVTYDATFRRKTPLATRIATEITRDGPMPIAEFMARCLWDQTSGYYATRIPLGSGGDFITAPEISQVFGELIGLWAAVVWRDALAASSPFALAELGPGRGTLMHDMLRATKKVPGFGQAARCHLVEASLPLIELQKRTLADSGIAISWSADLDGLTTPAIIVANEFFDALPVRQWIKTPSGWSDRAVIVDDGGALQFGERPTSGQPLPSLPADAPVGAIAEHRDTAAMFAALARAGSDPVVLLAIDYGHDRSVLGDTLQAVRNHGYEHPLTSPGEADLSSHVDFEALALASRSAGFDVQGPVTQAEFLGQLGIIERTKVLMSANPSQAAAIESGIARLISPDGMGGRFKVMAVCSLGVPPLPGLIPQARRGPE